MAYDFPNSPTIGQRVTMPDSTVRSWDGTKWRASSATGSYTAGTVNIVGRAIGPVGNGLDTTEDTLLSVTVPGGTVAVAGQTLHAMSWGSTSSGSINRILKCYYGVDLLGTLNLTGTQFDWWLDMMIMRTNTGAQLYMSHWQEGPDGAITGGRILTRGVGGQDFNNSLNVRVTGQTTGSSAGNNIIADALIVELMG